MACLRLRSCTGLRELRSQTFSLCSGNGLRQLGLEGNKSAFLLFSEFAYQGTGGTFKEMAQAISRKDKEAALAALKTTKAYDYSQPARKAHYEKLVLASLEGK